MNESMNQVVREMTMRVHALHRAQAAELHNAANHRQHGDYTRAAIAAHAAEVDAGMATIYQQLAGVVSGTWLPSADEVIESAEGLGAGVGIVRWAPPVDASPAQLHQWRAFADAVNQVMIRQKYRTDDLIPAAHETQVTGQLAPEDVPGPDPLSASPAEESDAHHTAQAGAPDRKGTGGGLVEPDGDAQCDYCLTALVRIEGAWLHAQTMQAECGTDGGSILQATPVGITVRGATPDGTEPGHKPEPPAEPRRETALQGISRVVASKALPRRHKAAHAGNGKAAPASSPYAGLLGRRVVVRMFDGTRAHGVLDVAGEVLVLNPHEDGPKEIRAALVEAVHELLGRAGAGVVQLEPGGYPDQPAVPPVDDPAQARMGEVAAQRREDPSALMLPPKGAVDGEATQAFPPPVIEGGNG